MNYLGHFVYNHDVCGLPAEPFFVVGAALPDLWPRFSRTRRLRWPAVRAATPTEPAAVQLRAGLLNHVAVDRVFHVLPCFLAWQRELKQTHTGCLPGAPGLTGATDVPGLTRAAGPASIHPWLLDFLTHVALELTLDHLLVRSNPRLAERFYASLAAADADLAASAVGRLGAVDTDGLAGTLRGFIARGYLRRYDTSAGLEQALRLCVELAPSAVPVPDELPAALLAQAAGLVQPATVWAELGAAPPTHVTSAPHP